ncbi:MAG: NAD(P)H-binding protein, partial [Streptomycetaceae bacterium]|nr:NAD(P)H-binding protein [Streptomycetaceae bacterium]
MPVVVTGADQPLGRALALALAERGVPDVRAVVRDRGAAPALRTAGVRVSVGDLSDPLRIGAVLEGAHTVVHLDGSDTGGTPGGGPLATWEWLVEAAEGTGLRRIVTVLPQGSEPPQNPAYQTVFLPGEIPRPGAAADPALVAALIEADRRR